MADWTPPDAPIKGDWKPPDPPIDQSADQPVSGGIPVITPAAKVLGDLAVYPFRALGADIYAGIQSKGGTDPEAFNKARERGLEFTETKRTPTETEIERILSLPGAAAQRVVSEAGQLILGPERAQRWGPYATTVGDALPFATGGLTAALRGFGRGAPAEAVTAAKAENRARQHLSQGFQTGLYEGGPSALDAVEAMQQARAAGQPMTLLDVNNPEMQGRIGTIFRQGGPAKGQISDFLKERKEGQGARERAIIEQGMGNADTFTSTAERLRDQRSTNARPAFAEAAKGPGLKAFQDEFTNAWAVAGREEQIAAGEVSKAQTELTAAKARQSQAGNVYSTSGANTDVAAAEARVSDATQLLKEAQQRKGGMQQMMQTAQQDGTLRPDAIWSPYLDMLRTENPEIRGGLARGWAIERNKAHGAGERPNPRDYAIVGFDDAGAPIVGAVPNMKLWMVAKEGLDAQIADNIRANKGNPDKMGHSLIELRNGLITELDRLNPRYKPARDLWEGDSNSMIALERGQRLLDTGRNAWFKTDEEAAQYVRELNPGDKEFVKLGLAQELMRRVREAPDAADKAKRVINSEASRDRIRLLLGPEADRFISAVEREADMEKTRAGLTGGSPTAARRAQDIKNERIFTSGGHALKSLFTGHPLSAALSATRAVREWMNRPDPAMNAAVGRVVTDPNVSLSTREGGPILPPINVPKRYMMTPGRALAAGGAIQPRDPLAEALR